MVALFPPANVGIPPMPGPPAIETTRVKMHTDKVYDPLGNVLREQPPLQRPKRSPPAQADERIWMC